MRTTTTLGASAVLWLCLATAACGARADLDEGNAASPQARTPYAAGDGGDGAASGDGAGDRDALTNDAGSGDALDPDAGGGAGADGTMDADADADDVVRLPPARPPQPTVVTDVAPPFVYDAGARPK